MENFLPNIKWIITISYLLIVISCLLIDERAKVKGRTICVLCRLSRATTRPIEKCHLWHKWNSKFRHRVRPTETNTRPTDHVAFRCHKSQTDSFVVGRKLFQTASYVGRACKLANDTLRFGQSTQRYFHALSFHRRVLPFFPYLKVTRRFPRASKIFRTNRPRYDRFICHRIFYNVVSIRMSIHCSNSAIK